MKFIIILIVIIAFVNCASAQTPLSQWSEGSELSNLDWIFFTDVSDKTSGPNGTSKKVMLEILKAFLLSGDLNFTGTSKFDGNLRLPPLSNSFNAPGYVYQDGSDLYFRRATWNGAGYDYSWQKILLKVDADATYSVDTTSVSLDESYMTLNTNQDVNSVKNFFARINFHDKVVIEGGSSLPTNNDEANRIFIKSSGDDPGVYYTNSNNSWTYGGGSGSSGLPITGSYSGITSSLTWTQNGIRYVTTSTGTSSSSVHAGMPVYTSLPSASTMYNGDFANVAGQIDTDGSGEELHGIYFLYTDADYFRHWGFAPDLEKVQRMIKATLGSDAPVYHNNSIDTLDFSINNYSAGIFGAQGHQNVEVINYGNGWAKCAVKSQDGVTFNFPPTVNVGWPGGVVPAFNDGKKYKLYFEFDTATEATVDIGGPYE